MRRLIRLVLATLLTLLLVVPAAAASADAASEAATGGLVLAVEGEPTGPEPMDRQSEDNPARELAGYDDREVQFTWGAAWILLFLGIAGLVVLLGTYRWLVVKPSQQAPRH